MAEVPPSVGVTAIVPVAGDGADPSLAARLDSLSRQTGVGLEAIVVAGEGVALPAVTARVVRVPKPSPAALRNAGLAAATAPYACVVEAGERLKLADALASQVHALEADAAAMGVYGRTEVEEAEGVVRARPDRGRGGLILRRLVQHKGFIASSASVLWRRALLPVAPYDDAYRTAPGLLLALLASRAVDHAFLYNAAIVASAPLARETAATQEENVKVFVALLYGATRLEERLEARVRFRLARHLVALGKHHYRKGDHARAGKLFAEAVKAAPSYFKGRRYQFMNFLKGVIARA